MTVDIVLAEGDRDVNLQLASILKNDAKFNFIAGALTGLECISQIMRNRPNVVVATSRLPDLDLKGLIKRVMRQYPTPMLILFSSEDKEIIKEIEEMDIGIIDFLPITRKDGHITISEVSLSTRIHILSKLKIEKFSTQIKQGIKLTRSRMHARKLKSKIEKNTNRGVSSLNSYSGRGRSSKIVVIGTSTGGPRLLSEVVPKFPQNMPPILIVQHMPIGFISAFSRRLDRSSKIRVTEAKSGEKIMPGTIYLAPGGKHLELHRAGNNLPKILLTDGPAVNFVKPAVDVTLQSATKVYGRGVISVILTGMGSDGRDGSRKVKENGGIVLALNEEDADIYGMNRAVIEAGLVDEILSKNELVTGIIRAIEGKI